MLLLDPVRGLRGQAGREVLLSGRIMGEELDQLLIVDLPSQLAADSTTNGAAAGPSFPADGQRQPSGNWIAGPERRPVPPEPVKRGPGRGSARLHSFSLTRLARAHGASISRQLSSAIAESCSIDLAMQTGVRSLWDRFPIRP